MMYMVYMATYLPIFPDSIRYSSIRVFEYAAECECE